MGPKRAAACCIPEEGIGGPAHFAGSEDCHKFGHGIHERSRVPPHGGKVGQFGTDGTPTEAGGKGFIQGRTGVGPLLGRRCAERPQPSSLLKR
jgi:hypothetical protein